METTTKDSTLHQLVDDLVWQLRPLVQLLRAGLEGERTPERACLLEYVLDDHLPRVGAIAAQIVDAEVRPQGLLTTAERVMVAQAALVAIIGTKEDLRGIPRDWTARAATELLEEQQAALVALQGEGLD